MNATVVERLRRLFPVVLQIEAPSATDDLVDGGILDSLGLVELLVAIEVEFAIVIPLDEIEIERMRSIERLAELVTERLARDSTDAA